MKKLTRALSLLLTALLLSSSVLTACSGGGEGVGTSEESRADTAALTEDASGAESAPGTEPDTEPVTEAETVDPRDLPHTDAFRTTSNLVYDPYFYLTEDEENDGILPAARDVFADTWTATDGAARSLPLGGETITPTDKTVGIFYFLWNEANLNSFPLYDHYKAYLEGGTEGLWDALTSGELGFVRHYWAEPLFGYYSSEDEWVIRKHAYMLCEAGVDFVFFDVSNGVTYKGVYDTVLRVWKQMRDEGARTPQVCFLSAGSSDEFNSLWNDIYSQNRYEPLWFRWEGKPLILLSGGVSMTDEQADFFTVRYSWCNSNADWYNTRGGKACWPWRDQYPQKAGKSPDGSVEQMTVTCGYGVNGKWGECGRSMQRSRIPAYEGEWDFGFALMDTTTPLGLLFADQFGQALKKDPPLLMITGWNEWNAGRWEGGAAAGQIVANQYTVSNDPSKREYSYYVDNFDPEYSRDIEPMKGGFTDNYYYQMASYIRQYKGSRSVETAFGQWAIDIHGSVGQWYAVGPEYRDYAGDTVDRDAPSHLGGLRYENTSGRNDLVTAKVSTDSTYLYFMVECASEITAPEGADWMNLFLDTDCDPSTGWCGFDFVLNRERTDKTLTVCALASDGTMTAAGEADYALSGRVLQIRAARDAVGFTGSMDFKWADHSLPTWDVMEFWTEGDAAPDGRYTYRFTLTEEGKADEVPSCLTSDMVVLKANGYNAFVGGREVMLDERSTKAVCVASGYDFWLPVSFVREVLSLDPAGLLMSDHYGVEYVKASDLVRASGKAVSILSDGLIVISDAPVSESVMRVLYRAMH